ncbi:hypothetical protein K461DRAFT_282616 [Myriangium duriaei CBS 260.36]|uniref:Uncharacterized protein n=1 Tax=Myriangium duriaei CBS 260.36 TaxID=1168546 RepID=A0A9P4MHT0_9PEZI|nr:hypothetical protein K461DRAFT_282616 [Myriangium duriaei CBS 260.36]
MPHLCIHGSLDVDPCAHFSPQPPPPSSSRPSPSLPQPQSSFIAGSAVPAADTPRRHFYHLSADSNPLRLLSSALPIVATPHIPAAAQLAPSPSLQQARKRPLSRGGNETTTLLLKKTRPPPLTSSKSSSAVPTLSTTSASASPTSLAAAPRSPVTASTRTSSAASSIKSPRIWLSRSVTATPVLTAADSLRQSIMLG